MADLKKKLLAIRVLGILQIIVGVLSVILGVAEIASANNYDWSGNSGAGIWGGIWIGVTGILGTLLPSFKNNNCLNGTHLGFCIVAMVLTWINGIIYITFISYTNNCWNWYFGSEASWGCSYDFSAAQGISGTLLFLMMIEFAFALTASILGCQTNNSCCCKQNKEGFVVATQEVNPNNTTIITLQPNQYPNFLAQSANQQIYYQSHHAQQPGASGNLTITLQPNQNPIYTQPVSSIYYHPTHANVTLSHPSNEQIGAPPHQRFSLVKSEVQNEGDAK